MTEIRLDPSATPNGVVYLNCNGTSTWNCIWDLQSDDHEEYFTTDLDEAVAWARSKPAHKVLIYNERTQGYQRLENADLSQVGPVGPSPV